MRIILLLFFYVLSFNASSQLFSTDREKFVKDFQKNIATYGTSSQNDFVKQKLSPLLLEGNDFSAALFDKMIATCNTLSEKEFTVASEIYQYVYSFSNLIISKQQSESIDAWLNTMDILLKEKSTKKLVAFIDLSSGFFTNRKLAGKEDNYNWFFEGGEYSFEYTDQPYIKCSNGILICRYPDDGTEKPNVIISNTNGIYNPTEKTWNGQGGQITWEKAGLIKDSTYATLRNYSLSLKSAEIEIDSVSLTSKYFKAPILGKLSDKAVDKALEDNTNFPEFISYEKRLKIDNIIPNVNYEGGFYLRGNTFIGQGIKGIPASITYFKEKQPFFYVTSEVINISPQKISCFNAKSCLKLSKLDSITHISVDFSYDIKNGNVEFSRTKLGNGLSPFYDSYHKLYMYVPKIIWKIKEDKLSLTFDYGTSQEQRYASFESVNYFSEKTYDQMQGMDAVHPLKAIYDYSIKNNTKVLQEGALASAMGRTVSQIKPLLIELSNGGFVAYDAENKTITTNAKLENYVLGKSGSVDFDNIIFQCDMRPKDLTGYSTEDIKANPELKKKVQFFKDQAEERRSLTEFGNMNLKTLELELYALDAVPISEPKNTLVVPDGNKVVIGKNRNFQFSGWINSGKMEIRALSANYNYDDHKINLLKTGKSVLRISPLKPEDGKAPVLMASYISDIKGEILVDNPAQRSGKDLKSGFYPLIKVNQPSYVFYNYDVIYEGAYDSSRFYYTIAPFQLDSLTNFAEKNFRIKGELTSAGIFPKINEDLVIMPDYSFGFTTKAPTGGYDFYGTAAKYDNKIVLSNNGLQGAGTINFVQSSSVSKLLTFLPDSTIGVAQFVNKPVDIGVQFPDVNSESALITYYPKKNQLKVQSTEKADLDFFKSEAKLKGQALITPAGMTGNGYMFFKTAVTSSKRYRFSRWDLDADTANFSLKNTYAEPGENDVAFNAQNVKSHVSFKERKGEFVSNQGGSILNFPVNQYACRMDRFSWFLDKTELQMENSNAKQTQKENDLDLAGPNFYSVNPKQDSLRFAAPIAKYDLKQRSIFCDKVEFLAIADAKIYPDSMKVIIRKDAYMEPFKNAKIVANSITKYHTFIKANAEVKARRSFTGDGEYAYYDKDSTLTYFKIKSIKIDTNFQTIATGSIDEQQGFKLSKEFDYYGKLTIYASDPYIHFDGATRINHNCENFDKNWMSFDAPINPKNIQIPVNEKMKNLKGELISAGIVWRDSPVLDSINLYPTFLSKLVKEKDPVLITANGFLQYNDVAKEFQISTKEKLLNRSEKGNFIALHTESCSLNGEGNVYLGMDYGDVVIDAVGIVNYNQSTGATTMNLTARFDMPLDKGVMQDVADRISAVELLKPMDFSSNTLEQAMVQWTDRKTADKLKSDYTLKGEIKKLPDEFEKSIVLTGLKLESFNNINNEEKGLISAASTATLVNLYGKPVLKNIPIRAFFQQIYSGSGADDFAMQFDIPALDYFFSYEMTKNDGILRIISSDTAMNDAINSIKEEKRKTRKFSYEVSTQRIYLSKFLRLFE